MSEEKNNPRSEQSRINGAQGQGPTTEEGKAVSAQNATKHNLSGKTFILLEGERLEDYEGLRDALLARYQPRDAYEHHLVETMSELEWKTARACRLEAESIGYEANRWKEGITRAAGTPGFETKQVSYGRYISNFRLNIKRIKEDLKEARSDSSAGILPVAQEEITKRTQDNERGAGVPPAEEEATQPQDPHANNQQPALEQQSTKRTQDSERGAGVPPAKEEGIHPQSPPAQEPQQKNTKRTRKASAKPSRLTPRASRLDHSNNQHSNNQQPTRNWTPPTPPFPLWVPDEARSREFAKRMRAAQDD